MKSVLLHINNDPGQEARLQVALDIVRASGGHLTCLHITPVEAYMTVDGFGAAFAATDMIAALEKEESATRQRVEAELSNEGVSWNLIQETASSASALLGHSCLHDVVILSRPRTASGQTMALALIGDIVVKASTPVLAVPDSARGIDPNGTAVVAWNGSYEGANALRFALPMLAMAKEIHIVTIEESKVDANSFPSTSASEYLSRHGLSSTLHDVAMTSGSAAEALLGKTVSLGADYLVMGAYGHNRAIEYVFGGVTRFMLREAPLPLLIAH